MAFALNPLIDSVLPEVVRFRHDLHKIPESSGCEFKSSEFIRKKIGFLPLKIHKPYLQTDVVADLQSKETGRNIVLRADIDALPIQEKNSCSYKSQHPGFMHGCGHDAHSAMLYGAAMVLSRLRQHIKGNVRFVWQPGEENLAMGKQLVDAGVLENPAADMVSSIHGIPGVPIKTVTFKPGPMMAACAHWEINITGKGAHGSRPDLAVDPLYLGAVMVQKIHDLAINEFGKKGNVVLSSGKFNAGCIDNVIPDTSSLSGTARFFSMEDGKRIEETILRHLDEIVAAAGAKYEFAFDTQYIPSVNDPDITEFARKIARKYMIFSPLTKPLLIAEDFSFYLQKVPGVYALLGLGEDCAPLHSPEFDFPDECLAEGIKFFCRLVLEEYK